MADSKDLYRRFAASESSIPIFSRPWWLDATAGESSWDVAIIERGGQIVGSLPYAIKSKYSFTVLTQPQLTQTLGPWLRESTAKYANKLGWQKDVMQELIAKLPFFVHFAQNWHYSQTNWLPFFWNGFRQTTKYTYVLSDLSNEDVLWEGLRENIRSDIRKASTRVNLRVRDDVDVKTFLKLNRHVFARQGRKLPYPDSLVERLDNACLEREARKIFIAEDKRGRMHAGAYIIWDENSAYYLMGGSDPALRNSGAGSLCLWEAIKFASKVTRRFDFEGSMLESVERYFRAFGAQQMPYFRVYKTPSKVLQCFFLLKEVRSETGRQTGGKS